MTEKWDRVAVPLMKITTAVQVGHNEKLRGNNSSAGNFGKEPDGPAE
jgi:hypothetical protein